MRSAGLMVIAVLSLVVTGMPHAQGGRRSAGRATVTRQSWGTTAEGQGVDIYTLTNASGMRMKVTNYGCIITELHVPDRRGRTADVVLGFDSLAGYLAGHPFFGCVVGRYANRIARGRFTLDGREYQLAVNNPPNHLHGGEKGFDKYVWQAGAVSAPGSVGVRFRHTSPGGDENYPGTLKLTAVYALTDSGDVRIEYSATTDQPTIVNLTNHSYFNLAGHASGSVLKQRILLKAARYTPTDDTLIPTGALEPVRGTPLDFSQSREIGERITLLPAFVNGGYDHNFVIDRAGPGIVSAAVAMDPASGRTMEMLTSEPGVQFYTGNFLDGSVKGKGGASYRKHAGFCLEAQKYPDTPNKPAFPSCVLRQGQTYRHVTIYRFRAQ